MENAVASSLSSHIHIPKSNAEASSIVYSMEVVRQPEPTTSRLMNRRPTLNPPAANEPPLIKEAKEKNSQKKRKFDDVHRDLSNPTKPLPDMPLIKKLDGLVGECSKPVLRGLTASDLRANQCRLKIGKDDAISFLLPMMDKEEATRFKKEGINVIAYDHNGNKYDNMMFKLWTKKSHVINGAKWKDFVNAHIKLFKDEYRCVVVWMFRYAHDTKQICFLIIPAKEDGNGGYLLRNGAEEEEENQRASNSNSSRRKSQVITRSPMF